MESKYVEETYRVKIRNEDERSKLKKRIQLTRKSNGVDQKEPASICMLPPLTFQCRTTIYNIDKIDIIAQSFQTDFYCDLRLLDIIDSEDSKCIDTLFEHYMLNTSRIKILNVSEVKGDKELWSTFSRENKYFTYCVKMRMTAVINEQMELQPFPFDIQPMNIGLTFNACTSRAALEVNNFFPSLFLVNQFQLSDVYDVVYKDIVLCEVKNSDSDESSAGFVYPRCYFKTYFARRPHYYMSNVMMPMTVITLLGPLSNAIEADGSLMGIGDRLSVSLTLLLTAVAYKFIVASSIPQVSYLTALDEQVLLCFAFLVLSAVENVVYSCLVAQFDVDSTFESYYIIAYYCGFVLCHFLLFTKLGLWFVHRNRFFKHELRARQVMKETYIHILERHFLERHDTAMVKEFLDEVLFIKGLKSSLMVLDESEHLYALTRTRLKIGEQSEAEKSKSLISEKDYQAAQAACDKKRAGVAES